ncbi:MAG: sigma-54-dependent Fis family transcriptional regulator [Planctomycetes bacterium]|nr:sigma-54-dependent Fis family transcriptional regulator [Planctomycetota bacterium]
MASTKTLSIVEVGEGPALQLSLLQGIAGRIVSVPETGAVLQTVRDVRPELIVIRETVPPATGLAVLRDVRGEFPDAAVVAVSQRADVDEAVLFLRHGACDYLRAPLDEHGLRRIADAARGERPHGDWAGFFAPECPPDVPIVGCSEGTRTALRMVRLVAESQCDPVMVLGETGTGKELVACALHALRGGSPDTFVAVNCATLTANLLESELFGHVKGAFTGADRDKTGLFELAEGGSLFLDEISEMPLNLQAKLLRVLQEREFRKVGGTKTIRCGAQVIASSNRDPAAEVKEGRLRKDLYYRLAVFPVHLPPLRSPQRRDDVPLLAEYFMRARACVPGNKVRSLSPDARGRLLTHDWPGNVRELRNVIERAMILETSDCIGAESLVTHDMAGPPAAADGVALPDNDFSLETAERLFITRALRETDWQRTRAAALLGITRATLHAKLKRYCIKIPDDLGELPASERVPVGCSRLQGVLP